MTVPERLHALFDMSRSEQLLLVLVVYATGWVAAVSGTLPGLPEPVPALDRLVWGGLALLPLAASVHYVNEYADWETDRLADPTPFSGGSGAVRRFDVPRSLPRLAAVVALVVGAAVTAVATAVDALPPRAGAVLVVITVLGWAYSLPPVALVRRGVGEVDNALLGGLLLPLYGVAVATGDLGLAAGLAFVPFTLLVFANLLTTHWPDREPDAAVGKDTLVTRFRPGRLRLAYWGVVVAAYGSLAALHGGVVPPVVCFAGLVAAPLSVWGGLVYTRQRSPFPAVAAMVAFVAAEFLAWTALVAGWL